MEPNQREKPPPKGISPDIAGSIKALVDRLEAHPNPFMVEEVKKRLLEDHDHINEISVCAPNSIKAGLESLFEKIDSSPLDLDQKNQVINYFQISVESIQIKEHKLWKYTDILLKTPTVKSLQTDDYQQLIRMLNKVTQEQFYIWFSKILKEMKVSQKEFESQLKMVSKKKLTLNKFLNNIFSQRVVLVEEKTKQESSCFYENFKKEKQKNKSFQTYYIEVSNNKNRNEDIRGRILSSESVKNMTKFKLSTIKQGMMTITLYDNSEFIDRVKIRSTKYMPLDQYLKNLLKRSENYVYRVQCSLEINHKQMGKSSFISSGEYLLTRKQIENSKNYELHFESVNYSMKSHFLVVHLAKDNNNRNIIQSKGDKMVYSMDEFLKSYFIRGQVEREIQFQSKEENNRFLNIRECINTQTQEGLRFKNDEINQKKMNLIGNILSLSPKERDDILKQYIDKNSTDLFLRRKGVKQEINSIIQFNKELEKKSTTEEIVEEILSNTNYVSLVSKQDTISSIKTIELFAQSQESTETMKDKNIISFFGNTGSGKSTSINYFLGASLQLIENENGQESVKFTKEEQGYCTIGHSNVLSETLFSRGYQISEDNIAQNEKYLHDVVLCDNPGFIDTRGTSYEICTNLSIDRSIEVSKNLKAIVLVIPYETFTADRGSRLIGLITSLLQRFPRLIDRSSSTFNRFFILITKAKQSMKKLDPLKKIFSANAMELKQRLKNISSNPADRELINSKLQIFACLEEMCYNKQIDFIKIDDPLQGSSLLQKYANSSFSINKDEYRSSMHTNFEMKRFINQVNITVHSWNKFLLGPFLKQLPRQIERQIQRKTEIQNNITNLMKSKEKYKEDKKILAEKLKKAQQNLVKCQRELKRVENKNFTSLQLQIIESQCSKVQIPKYVNQYDKQIQFIKDNIEKERSQIKINEKKIQSFRDKFVNLSSEYEYQNQRLNDSESLLNRLKEGFFKQLIYLKEFDIDQKIYCGSGYSKQERLQYVERGQVPQQSQTTRTFLAGRQQNSLCKIIKIARKYKLLPSQKFDPKKYISNTLSTFGQYEAEVESNWFMLEGVKLFEEGKKIVLSLLMQFIVTENQTDLPLLKISHKIPKEEHNFDTIRNLDSDIKSKKVQLFNMKNEMKQFTKNIELLELNISLSMDKLIKYNQNLKQIQQKNTKARNIKQEIIIAQNRVEKQSMIQDEKKTEVNSAKIHVLSYQKRLESIKNDIQRQQKELKMFYQQQQTLIKGLNEYQFSQKRLAFLIKKQLEKKVPQSLKQFIRIAFDMRKESQKKNCSENNESEQLRTKNFHEYLKLYEGAENDIKEMIENILGNKH